MTRIVLDVSIYFWKGEGRYPVEEEGSVPLDQQDTQPLEQVPYCLILLLACPPGLNKQ